MARCGESTCAVLYIEYQKPLNRAFINSIDIDYQLNPKRTIWLRRILTVAPPTPPTPSDAWMCMCFYAAAAVAPTLFIICKVDTVFWSARARSRARASSPVEFLQQPKLLQQPVLQCPLYAASV